MALQAEADGYSREPDFQGAAPGVGKQEGDIIGTGFFDPGSDAPWGGVGGDFDDGIDGGHFTPDGGKLGG